MTSCCKYITSRPSLIEIRESWMLQSYVFHPTRLEFVWQISRAMSPENTARVYILHRVYILYRVNRAYILCRVYILYGVYRVYILYGVYRVYIVDRVYRVYIVDRVYRVYIVYRVYLLYRVYKAYILCRVYRVFRLYILYYLITGLLFNIPTLLSIKELILLAWDLIFSLIQITK